MFPVRDNVPSKTVPFVNVGLIALNLAVFWHELVLGRRLEPFLLTHGLVPAHPTPEGVLTSMFLHGGWLHVLGNMWFLWVFGDNVEDRLGHFRYLGFYLLCGVAAALIQVVSAPHSRLPVVGASGAIAGVLGAYLLFFPKAKVTTLIPIFIIIPYLAEIPAFLFLGVWFIMQLYAGTLSLGARFADVAWWAHVGGFAAGMLLAFRWGRRKAKG
ncbi:MAG: rhomboid family intramembrane serine protease [Elusimicrobia bacterium]|nr:rhomboid family intramembrane serine protease [Elusimicrobiota bacterium]